MPEDSNKAYKKEYFKKYYESHKEELLDYQKKYQSTHKEEIREYNRNRRPNKDKIKKYHKDWYKKNGNYCREKSRLYSIEHKEEISAKRKKRRAENPNIEKERHDSYKIFHGKNPRQLFCKYINNQFYRYISSFRSYLLIAKSEKMISYMTRLGLGTILEEDVITEILASGIEWTKEDEEIYLDTIQNTNPSGIITENLSFYKKANVNLHKDDDLIAVMLRRGKYTN